MTTPLEQPDSQPITYIPGLERVTTFRLRQNGADIVITDASFKLLAPNGDVLHDEPAPPGEGTALLTVTVPGAATVGEDPGGRYIEAWEADDALYTREAWLSLIMPVNPVTDEDLERMHSGILALAPDGSDPDIPADLTWAGKRDQVFRRLQARLAGTDTDQSAIVSWYAFLDYLAADCLRLISADLATEEAGTGLGRWAGLATFYGERADELWDRLGFGVDRDRDLIPDADGPSQTSGTGHGGRPGGRRW